MSCKSELSESAEVSHEVKLGIGIIVKSELVLPGVHICPIH